MLVWFLLHADLLDEAERNLNLPLMASPTRYEGILLHHTLFALWTHLGIKRLVRKAADMEAMPTISSQKGFFSMALAAFGYLFGLTEFSP